MTPKDLLRDKREFCTQSNSCLPDSSYPNFNALRIFQQAAEELEKVGKMRLESLNNALENGEKNVRSDFTMSYLR